MKTLLVIFIALLFVVGVLGGIILRLYQIVAAIVNFFFRDFINRNLLFTRLNSRSKAFLQKSFRYYTALNDADKRIFERRVQKFMNMKEFVPRGGLTEVTIEMKTLISAAAIQLTFGLPGIYFSHFHRILVYPDDYYSSVTKRYHRGEVDTRGIIVLSWKHLLLGYVHHEDGRNLGLHEMAHALKIVDSIRSDEYDAMDRDVHFKFIALCREEMDKIRNGEDSFFRSYAASNDYEFFAVAVENFFERSKEFASKHPDMFNSLATLLNQNPLQPAPASVS